MQGAFREALASGDNAVDRTTKLMDRLQRNILSVAYGQRDDVDFADALVRIVADYDLRASGVDLSVGKWPWEPFNDTSGGLQKDDYIVFYGRPKSKKSWILAAFVASLYLQDKTILVYTKEMTADNILTRVAACVAGLPYQELRTGRLSREDRQKLGVLQEVVLEMQSTQRLICLNGKDSNGNDTIEWIEAKAKKYKPDIIIIDGLYLMSDSRGSKNQKDNFRVQNISRAARQMVLNLHTPLIATLQATRAASAHKAANLDEIAFSDAIGQDVTSAIRVINDEETDTITLVVGGSREYKFSGCCINGKCAQDFSFIRNLSQKEIDSIKQSDERKDEKSAGVLPNGEPVPARKKDPKKGLPSERSQIDRQFNRLNRPGMRVP
jgi:replicative DNA helicase